MKRFKTQPRFPTNQSLFSEVLASVTIAQYKKSSCEGELTRYMRWSDQKNGYLLTEIKAATTPFVSNITIHDT